MAGYRCPNYFTERVNESGFNSGKYKSYFPYLNAAGNNPLRNVKLTKNSEIKELHGIVYMRKSRSRAGSVCQT